AAAGRPPRPLRARRRAGGARRPGAGRAVRAPRRRDPELPNLSAGAGERRVVARPRAARRHFRRMLPLPAWPPPAIRRPRDALLPRPRRRRVARGFHVSDGRGTPDGRRGDVLGRKGPRDRDGQGGVAIVVAAGDVADAAGQTVPAPRTGAGEPRG